jgi:hypothetical protein
MDAHKTKENIDKACICSSSQGLFIPNRQLSIIVAGCIAILFFSFITGYFLGNQHAAQDFMHHIDRVSLNDQVSASLCAFAKECSTPQMNEDTTIELEETLHADDTSVKECVVANADVSTSTEPETEKQQYYAQLIGFGTQPAAQRFAKKMENRHISVEINKHSSRTAKGKTIHWYQVVTTRYDNKQQLLDLVNSIQKAENIQDIRIVTC